MNCEQALELLSGHIDGANTPEEEAQLQAHLASCADCRAILAAYEELDSGLSALKAQPPAALAQNVMEAVRQEASAGKKIRRFPVRSIAATAVAAALLLVVGTTYLPKLSRPDSAEATVPDVVSYEADTPVEDTAALSKAMPAADESADVVPDTVLADGPTSEDSVSTFTVPQSDSVTVTTQTPDTQVSATEAPDTTADTRTPNTMTATAVTPDALTSDATDPTVAYEAFPDGVGMPELLVELTDDPDMPAASCLASLDDLTASPTASDRIVFYKSTAQTIRQILVEVQTAQDDGAAYNILRPVQLDTAADDDVCGLLVIQP